MGDIRMAEVVDDLVQKPDDARESTSTVNTTQMLRVVRQIGSVVMMLNNTNLQDRRAA